MAVEIENKIRANLGLIERAMSIDPVEDADVDSPDEF